MKRKAYPYIKWTARLCLAWAILISFMMLCSLGERNGIVFGSFAVIMLLVLAFSPAVISIYAIRRARMRWRYEINVDQQAQLARSGGGGDTMEG
jgi:membrane protein YdbS with pleckstrin-like domain